MCPSGLRLGSGRWLCSRTSGRTRARLTLRTDTCQMSYNLYVYMRYVQAWWKFEGECEGRSNFEFRTCNNGGCRRCDRRVSSCRITFHCHSWCNLKQVKARGGFSYIVNAKGTVSSLETSVDDGLTKRQIIYFIRSQTIFHATNFKHPVATANAAIKFVPYSKTFTEIGAAKCRTYKFK